MHTHSIVPLTLDLVSVSIIAGWWADIVPSVATTLTAIWVGYQIIAEIHSWFKKKK